MMAQQMADQTQQTVGAILQSSEEGRRENMLVNRQLAMQQQQTLEVVQQGNQQIIAAMTAPKRVVRGPDGFARAVVIDTPPQR
jgi:hypothetical protein